jgi:hypothetical protein
MFRRRAPQGEALYALSPAERLDAARRLDPKAGRRLQAAVTDWPPLSPAAANAWLLLVTTKPPQWRDPLLEFPEAPLALGEPHPGFLYPDPIDFWVEVRRWTAVVAGTRQPPLAATDAVAVSGLLHLGDDLDRLTMAVATVRPQVVLFLDEPAWSAAALPGDNDPFGGWWRGTRPRTIAPHTPWSRDRPEVLQFFRFRPMRGANDRSPRPETTGDNRASSLKLARPSRTGLLRARPRRRLPHHG